MPARPRGLPTDAVRLEFVPGRLMTQREAAALLAVSVRYLRESSCPKVLLPGHGARGKQLVRYDATEVQEWAAQWRTSRRLRDQRTTERRAS